MRKLVLCLTVLSFGFFCGAHAQDTVQLFGGFSYVRQSINYVRVPICQEIVVGPVCPPQLAQATPNLNGWDISGTFKLHKWFGLTADFDGSYGSVGGVPLRLYTYLFGPESRYHGRVSPFVHALFGAAHESNDGGGSTPPGFVITASTVSGFSMALGAGIDIRISRFVSFRAIHVDYLQSRFISSTVYQPRVSGGLVIRF